MARKLLNVFVHFDPSLPHHQRFARALEALLPAGWLDDNGPGGRIWINQDQPIPPPPPPPPANRVQVPYCSQLDNGHEGWRQCQTSSIAMCLLTLHWSGIRDDREYLRVVERFGDTTSQQSHGQALQVLGVRHRFTQTASVEDVKAQLRVGRPVPAGVLHHGPAHAATGGGHWIVLIGFDDQQQTWIAHDPYGELELVMGGWSKIGGTSGRAVRYSYKNLNPRIFNPGPRNGWIWLIG